MKDLEREEELRRLISVMRDKCDKEKWRRIKRTFFVLCGVVYLAAFIWGGINNMTEFFCCLMAGPIISAFIIYASTMVLFYISSGAMDDEKYIARLEGELNAITQFNRKKDE
jgi:hypothetical protein